MLVHGKAQTTNEYMLVSQALVRHTLTPCSFVVFGSIAQTQQNGFNGAHRVIDLEQFPVRISKDEAPTPLPSVGLFVNFSRIFVKKFFSSDSSHSPLLFLCIAMSDVIAFRSFFVVTTLSFTIYTQE